MERDRCLLAVVLLFTVYEVYLSASETVHQNQCSRTFLGRLGSGIITSYNFPFDYRDNLTCIYRIYLDNKANGSQTVVCLTFRRFSLENSSPFCSFDYVELGLSPPMKYCGTGLWQYGVEKKGNLFSNIWSQNLCWPVQNSDTFDLVFSSDNSINGTGFHASFQVLSTSPMQSYLHSVASDQGPCRTTDWTCFNRKCIASRLLCDGQNDCGDWSDESYAHARCEGQNILACDFSDGSEGGFCAFNHEGWIRSSEIRRSNGPPGDHTNGSSGFYIYSEGSSYLVSPQLSLSGNATYCLSFWYFIYGAAPSVSLSVYISREQAYSRPEWMRHVKGMELSHEWSLGEVTIHSESSLQVIFASLSSNNESGTALDDISIMQGSCSGVDISCNFESGLCGWESASRLSHSSGTRIADHSWQIQSQEQGSLGPKLDHSSNDGSGSFLYAEFSAPITPSSQAILISPAISAIPDEVLCLQFWYYTGKRTTRSACIMSVMLHHYYNVLSGDIWSQVPSGDDTWKQANIEFEVDGPIQVILLASVRSGMTNTDCSVAVDQLQVTRGQCTDEDVVVCDPGQYQCSSGHCIASHLVCDKVPHCPDMSDEDWKAGCFSMVESQLDSTPQTTSLTCPPATSFLCHSSAFCIPRGWLCDLFNDCGDMSDEGPLAGCPDDVQLPHPSTIGAEVNFTMDASSSRSTIIASTRVVPSCEFSCADGSCVSLSQKCDGVNDCTNGRDEVNCSDIYVPPLTFFCRQPSMLCLNENRCLSMEHICDGRDDCLDGSDEAVSTCSDKLGYGAITGIVFGCCFSMLFLLLIALIARRRRKNCSIRQPHRPSRHPAHISTVFSVNNQGGIARQIDALGAFVSRNGESEQSRDRNRDNMGYIEEANRDSSGRAFPSEMHLMFGDAPPSYNSVLQDNGQSGERRQMLVRGNSADELEVPMSPTIMPINAEMVQNYEPPVGQSRNRRSYRSLPPTPARQPLVSYLQTSNDQHQSGGQRRSMLGYGAVSSHDDGCDHVYEDPGGAMQQRTSRSGSQMSGPPPVNVPPDVFPQSSVISPTLSSQRASRIRLGTMALQSRPGMGHGHGICSPVCTWHSSLVPDSVGVHSHRHTEYGNCECADPVYGATLNELLLGRPDESSPMHDPNSHHMPNARIAQSSNSSTCLSAAMQQNHLGNCHRDAPNHTLTSRRHRNSVENGADSRDFILNGFSGDPKSQMSIEHRDHRYPIAGDSKHPFIASNHQRSLSSAGFQDNLLSMASVGNYQSRRDDKDFSSPTCV